MGQRGWMERVEILASYKFHFIWVHGNLVWDQSKNDKEGKGKVFPPSKYSTERKIPTLFMKNKIGGSIT